VEQDIPEICAPCLRQELNVSLNWGGYPVSEGLSWYLSSSVLAGGASFLATLCLAFPFVFSVMGPAMRFYWIFCFPFGINLAMIN
jgi:hypothetical protein